MIYVASEEGFPILSLLGEFDIGNVDVVETAFTSLDSAPVLIVSLEKTEFIDSSILATLLRRHEERDGCLVVLVPQMSPAYRLFTITNLMNYFSVATNRAQAIRQAAILRGNRTVFAGDG